MPNFASSALRLLRRVLGSPSRDNAPYAGNTTPLDGNTAVAMTEAGISEGAGLGASFPADTAELAWRAEQSRRAGLTAASDLWSHRAEGPRGALATAIGLSLSGVRSTSFLASADLASAQDLLASAAGRHLPLVIHLGNRVLPGHAAAMGSGHEACHSVADSGCFMLFATNAQEAVDFTLVARRVAEQVLVPGVVIMDGEQTALALQDVRLPGTDLVTRYVGASGDLVPCPTTAQKLLFGENRRRLPRWHDLDRPVHLGGLQSTASWGLGKAADQVFVEHHLVRELDAAFKFFSDLTGRQHCAFSSHQVEDASLVMVVQGAAIETAEAVADHLKSTHRIKVGVLGLRALRPFPGARLAEMLGGKQRVLVLERMNSPAAGAPPLLRELQAALGRVTDDATHPSLHSVIYGLGGLPLRGADLIELCILKGGYGSTPIFLGAPFARAASPYPKRQVVLDRLRREYPQIAEQGLVSESATPDLRPPEALTLAIHRISGQGGTGLATEAAALLQIVSQVQLRSRPDLSPEPWGNYCVDRFTCAPAELRDPGDQMPINLLVLLAEARPTEVDALADLQQNGLLLLEDAGPGTDLPKGLVSTLRRSKFGLYRVAAFEGAQDDQASPDARGDYILGAIFGALLDSDLLDIKPRRLQSVREQLLMQLPDKERTARIGHFQEGMNRVHQLDRGTLRAGPAPAGEAIEEEAPLVVRKLHGVEETYYSLPRFWDQVGVLYRNGESNRLSPDPYMATGAIPPLTSAFRDLSPLRETLPSLDPALCDGCGNCWHACPDGAVGAIAQTPAKILDAAIGQVGADALRPLAPKLAARISSRCNKGETQDFGRLLSDASEWLQEKMSLPAGRKEGLVSAVGKVRHAVGDLPVIVTEPFFSETDSNAEELLLLAIDPNACKGCGICISACKPGALTAATQAKKNLQETRAIWDAWERLPDTPAAVCDRVGGDPRLGRLAGVLLSRANNASLAGGDAAEPGSGERLALRLAIAITESRQRPLTKVFIAEIRSTKEQISGLIREMLTDALPADDLDALARGLDKVETQQAELGDFVATAETSIDSGIDARHLRRLVHLAKSLEDLARHLSEGTQGLARAHLGVVLSGGSVSRWAGVFPNNPFATPAVLDLTRDSAQLAIGLLEGQLRQSTEGLQLMRRARLELESPDEAACTPASDHLAWRELTAQEQAICPPLFVVCGDDLLRGGGLSQLDSLLGSGLPIKLMILTELDFGLATRAETDVPLAASADAGLDLALLALARRRACIAQTSIANPEHLVKCLETALATPGPALLHLHAPSPLRHGFSADDTLVRASLAVESRLFPLFLFDPQAEGVFGSRLSLDGNPQPLSTWSQTNGADIPTPASWALGEQRFSHLFTEISGDDPAAAPVSDYLAIDVIDRTDRIPVVQAPEGAPGAPRYRVARELIRVCTERQQAWRVLQEIAGLVTPFTAHIEQTARDRVAADQEAALAALQKDYEARIATLQGEMLENTRREMRQRMMQLAGYANSGGTGQGGGAK